MSLSSAASWETGGASSVFVGHCPCCSDGVGVGVAVAVAVAVAVLAVTVAVAAVAASSSCMAAERASTLSAAESMAVCVEGGEGGGSCYLALGRCRVSSHISPAISSTARYINCTFFISPSPPPSPACRPDSPSRVSPSPAPRCGSTPRAPLPLPPPPGSSSDVPPPASSSASPYNSQTATKVYVLCSLYYTILYSLYYTILTILT